LDYWQVLPFRDLQTNIETVTLVPEVYFSFAIRNENNKNKPLDPGYETVKDSFMYTRIHQ
jgi:hypothetical protein